VVTEGSFKVGKANLSTVYFFLYQSLEELFKLNLMVPFLKYLPPFQEYFIENFKLLMKTVIINKKSDIDLIFDKELVKIVLD